MDKYSNLFKPLTVKGLTLKNRYVVPPMETALCDLHGKATPELLGYWGARAKGGYGLLILENSSVDPTGNVCPHTPVFYDDSCVESMRKLTNEVHKHDAKIAAQICHSGRQTLPGIVGTSVSASPIPCPLDRNVPHALTIREINEMTDMFADAAGRVKDSGFDAVEIHGAHGYLIAQFMSSYVNKRTDEFGGSFHNRMKFPLLIIEKIRKKVGDDYPVMFRLSCDERIPGGRKITESVIIAKILEEAGIDIIDVSVGVSGSSEYITAPACVEPGFLLKDIKAIRDVVSIPVIGVGRLNEPHMAEYALESGSVDLIAVGRGSLADPELPNKVKEGRIDETAPCISCLQGCFKAFPMPGSDAYMKYHTTCMVNPFCCEETKMVIKRAESPKKVVVVGAGPGGLETAWIAAAKGHKVVVFEKNSFLGGQLYYGAIPPYKQELAAAVVYYKNMCDKYKVEIRMNTEATVETVLTEGADAVILATGGTPIIPKNIEGVGYENIVTSIDILSGKRMPDAKALVIGGGMVGCEIADYLGEHKYEVALVEMMPVIAKDVPRQIRPFLMQRLEEHKVDIHTDSRVLRFTSDGVVIENNGRSEIMTGYDSIILAMGSRSYNTLESGLTGKVDRLFVIGDANMPGQAIDAIAAGAKAALAI